MNKLRQLAEFLKTLSPSQFDIRYIRHDSQCGTVCCAMGLAVSLWPEELRFFYTPTLRYDVILVGDHDLENDYKEIAVKFFNITWHEAKYIFSPLGYSEKPITIDHVIEHINEVIIRHEIMDQCEVFV